MFELALTLPDTLRFGNVGWFILHLCAIPLVFLIGMALGKKQAVEKGGAPMGGLGPA
jgi:hypothetical protein